MYEIERKYLAKPTIKAFITQNRLPEHKIVQFYTRIDAEKSVRYRKMDERYYKTVKKGSGGIRKEKEKEISKKRYKKMKKKHLGKIIKKRRYILTEGGLHYDIDLYEGELSGLHTMEVEFPDQTQYKAYKVPDTISDYLLEELTENEAYKNRSLSLYGIPSAHFTDLTLSVMFELPKESLESFLVGNLEAMDALRLILYKFTLLILHYESRMLQEDNPEALHQFRVNLRRSRALMKSFKPYFPPSWYTQTYEALTVIATQTNHARDLDVILTQLEKKKNPAIRKHILQEREKEKEVIKAMLNSESFKRFFNDYLSTLRSQKLRIQTSQHLPIKESAHKVLSKLHKEMIGKIEKEEKHFDPKVLHKIRIAFKKLRYLLEEFEEIFGKKRVERYIEEGKKLQTLLGEYNDAINQIRLLKEYRNNLGIKKASLSKKESEKLEKRASKLLKKVLKNLHRFKKEPFIL